MKKYNEDVKYLWNIEIKFIKLNGFKKWVGFYEKIVYNYWYLE